MLRAVWIAAALAVLLLMASPVSSRLATWRQPSIERVPSAPAATASDLRLALGRLLGEHAYLAMEAMRAAAAERADLQALVGGVDANTDDLAAAFADVYGAQAGEAFRGLWQVHIDALEAYARARAADDTAALDAATASLDGYRTSLSQFLAGANPAFSGDAEAHALQLHLDQLTSFVGSDYARSFETQRAAYAHMFDFGDHLARGIAEQFPDRFTGAEVAFSPSATLRLDLGRLLGEHLVLSAEAMRAGLVGRPDADAAANSLEANGADLAGLIGRVYGPGAEAAFKDLWGRHIGAYLAYIDGIRRGDEEKSGAALAVLHDYHTELAEFLHQAAPALSVGDLETLIAHHVMALINQVDAEAAGDHDRSVAVTRDAYAHMFVLGDALGTAISEQFPDRFEDMQVLPRSDAAADVQAPWREALLLLVGLATFVVSARDRARRPR